MKSQATNAKKTDPEEEAERKRKLAESIAGSFFDHIEAHRVEVKHEGFIVLYENEDPRTGFSSVSCRTCGRKLHEMDVTINLRDQVFETLMERLKEGSVELVEARERVSGLHLQAILT